MHNLLWQHTTFFPFFCPSCMVPLSLAFSSICCHMVLFLPYSNIKVLSFILFKDSQHCVNHFNLTWFTFSNPTFNDWITFDHSSCFKCLHVSCIKTLKAFQWTWKHVWFKHSTTFCICLVKSYLASNQLLQLDLISFLKFSSKFGDHICHNFHALKIHVLEFWSIIIPRKHI
jgi:hypothetical protein